MSLKVSTLSSSPAHYNLLLSSISNTNNNPSTTVSVLKIASTPSHIFTLPPSTFHSLLQYFTATLTSTSGSEYTYHTYTLSPSRYSFLYLVSFLPFPALVKNLKPLFTSPPIKLTCESISPASQRQVNRSKKTNYILINEKPEVYEQKVLPWIKDVVEGGGVDWLDNVIEKRKEVERILYDDSSILINVDTKWSSHHPLFELPKSTWSSDKTIIEDLYLLAYFKEKGLYTLRELRVDHIPVLKKIKEEGLKICEEVYGIQRKRVRVFMHYHPQFYSAHVHFNLVDSNLGVQCERAHLIEDVIEGIENGGWKERTIRFRVGEEDDLRKCFGEGEE
ncbi:hypothetical protein TrST_g10275 [Triparma strigata]|uniref:Scavenger mRNA decapping enzyme n=1 Tax=Triparma strigata TaxID=1606541 RepID=A0A9W6ZXS6_9STRA|nr:hypothetical protein TrST_g10275 [Triparma strigata]